MRKYDSYKESEIEYISEIPIHWKVKPLYTLFNEVKDKNKGNLESNVLSLSYGNIKKRNIESNMGLLPDSFETYNRIKKDDIVLRLTDLQNDKKSLRTGLVREKGIITSAYVTLRKRNENINAEYAHWLLHAFDVKKVFYNLGAGVRQSMGYSELKKMNLILPPRIEQKKIVDYLQHKISDIDKLVENLNVLINKLEQQRQSIITEAVTKGLNLNVKMKDSGVEWIGEIPKHWGIKKVKHFATHVGSGKTPSGGSEVYLDEGVPFLRSLNVHFDGIRLKDLVFISEETNSEMRHSQVKPLDILLNITGASIGRTALVPKDFGRANVNQHVCIIRLNQNKVYPYYFNIIMSSDVINQQIWFAQNGSSREGLNFVQVKELTFAIPPTIEEQREINEWIFNKQKGIFEVIASIKEQISKLKEYRQSLIYEAVTGKIDVRDMELD